MASRLQSLHLACLVGLARRLARPTLRSSPYFFSAGVSKPLSFAWSRMTPLSASSSAFSASVFGFLASSSSIFFCRLAERSVIFFWMFAPLLGLLLQVRQPLLRLELLQLVAEVLFLDLGDVEVLLLHLVHEVPGAVAVQRAGLGLGAGDGRGLRGRHAAARLAERRRSRRSCPGRPGSRPCPCPSLP